jgi:hypothetical protein
MNNLISLLLNLSSDFNFVVLSVCKIKSDKVCEINNIYSEHYNIELLLKIWTKVPISRLLLFQRTRFRNL